MTTPTTRRAANLFDLRRIIGGVFIGYGVLLTVLGLFDSQEEIDRAAGVNINLWTGLGMLVFGILMIVWALTRPLGDELVERRRASGARCAARRRRRGARLRAAPPRDPARPGSLRRARPDRERVAPAPAPPKPPPTMRAPAAPAAFSRATVRSTSGTEAA